MKVGFKGVFIARTCFPDDEYCGYCNRNFLNQYKMSGDARKPVFKVSDQVPT